MKLNIVLWLGLRMVYASDTCDTTGIVLPANTNTCSEICASKTDAVCSYTMTDYMSTDLGGGTTETCIFHEATTVYDGCATSLCTTTGITTATSFSWDAIGPDRHTVIATSTTKQLYPCRPKPT